METYVQSHGQYKTMVNGNIIDNAKWNITYDGDILDLAAKKNNESYYVQLTNDDIMKLFEIPPSQLSIQDRLENDLKTPLQIKPVIVEEVSTKTSPRKSSSRKSSSRKSSPRKSSFRKSSPRKSSSRKSKSKITPDYLKTIY